MKCSRVALLLTLVLTGRTAGVLAADDGTTFAGQQTVLLPLPCLEPFRQGVPFQSPIGGRSDKLAANASSPYDMYYANGLDWGYYEENSQDENGGQVSNGDKSGEKIAGADEDLAVDARLARSFQGGMSWRAASGKTAMGYASHCWEQAVTFLRDHSPNGEEAGLKPDDTSDDWAEADDETSPAETEHAAVGEPPRHEWVECLYVASCPKQNDAAFLATPGKVGVEYPLGSASQSAVFAEFYWADGEFCPSLASNSEIAMPWRSIFGDANQGRADNEQAPAAPSMATRLANWAKSSLNEWNVAFRNISRQIARLDWTLLLKSRLGDRAVRNTAPASNPIER